VQEQSTPSIANGTNGATVAAATTLTSTINGASCTATEGAQLAANSPEELPTTAQPTQQPPLSDYERIQQLAKKLATPADSSPEPKNSGRRPSAALAAVLKKQKEAARSGSPGVADAAKIVESAVVRTPSNANESGADATTKQPPPSKVVPTAAKGILGYRNIFLIMLPFRTDIYPDLTLNCTGIY
jgi:hypothetical protein